MKKTLVALMLVLVTAFALISCEGMFGNDNRDDKEEETKKISQIVIADSSIDVTSVRLDIFDKIGRMPTVLDSEPAQKCEIVFGNTNRAVTAEAKAKLEEYVNSKPNADVGYTVYSDGYSIAVYWQDDRLKDAAIIAFQEEYLDSGEYYPDEGMVARNTYTLKELEQEVYWIAIEKQASTELYDALKRLNSFYEGSTMCEWMANLWDDDYGGFYYSNSARDNEPYRPDLESTIQVTNWLTGNGAMTNINEQFPNWLKIKIVDFARNMQSAEHGYFIHPQWNQDINMLSTDRYGRDLSWGVSLINKFTCDRDGDGVEEKQYPKYCTPSGAKCEEHYDKEGEYCSFITANALGTGVSSVVTAASSSVTSTVRSSVSTLVSRIPTSTVVATASNKPNYSSSAAFTEWLESYCSSIEEDSGKAHNINALQDEIIAKGFCDELLDFLEKHQQIVWEEQTGAGITPTGLWQRETDYKFVWGILKYMPFFNDSKYGRPIQHAEEIVNACMEVIMIARRDPNYDAPAMNDLMNQWSSITSVISNVQNQHNDPELAEKIRQNLLARGAELVENSISKLEEYKLESGVFVYTLEGRSLYKIYNVDISLGLREGDVNGNALCSSYYRGMFTAFGFNAVPLCTSADGENFLDIIENCDPVVKNPLPKSEAIDFESNTYTTRVTLDARTSDGMIEVMDGPDGIYGNSLYFKSGQGAQYGDYLKIASSGTAGNCNILEFDFYHVSVTGTNTSTSAMYQIPCGDAFILTLGVSGDNLIIGSLSATSNGVSETLVGSDKNIKANEWHRIRLEIYDMDDGTGDAVAKIFVDDKLMARSTNYKGSQAANSAYDRDFGTITFYSRYHWTTECYFDNIYCNVESKDYDPTSDDVSDARN